MSSGKLGQLSMLLHLRTLRTHTGSKYRIRRFLFEHTYPSQLIFFFLVFPPVSCGTGAEIYIRFFVRTCRLLEPDRLTRKS
ncbi:hypothetical protein Agabi119p4_8458 [Agaricus bisporus var. burnettii]|uniref:Uncharacterized protein n=1 Tax=Agaricus bisporus var. burnettii TaxID=192524 RepID=A0A8H7EYS3_AGABI|nr:hypothetical protein Agabi119p4_8458 [Agaricus bisporus var. burnettii]